MISYNRGHDVSADKEWADNRASHEYCQIFRRLCKATELERDRRYQLEATVSTAEIESQASY